MLEVRRCHPFRRPAAMHVADRASFYRLALTSLAAALRLSRALCHSTVPTLLTTAGMCRAQQVVVRGMQLTQATKRYLFFHEVAAADALMRSTAGDVVSDGGRRLCTLSRNRAHRLRTFVAFRFAAFRDKVDQRQAEDRNGELV